VLELSVFFFLSIPASVLVSPFRVVPDSALLVPLEVLVPEPDFDDPISDAGPLVVPLLGVPAEPPLPLLDVPPEPLLPPACAKAGVAPIARMSAVVRANFICFPIAIFLGLFPYGTQNEVNTSLFPLCGRAGQISNKLHYHCIEPVRMDCILREPHG
jgi:hypothetical protein